MIHLQPLSYNFKDKKRGFAFVEFEEAEDAYQALENLNRSEFYGRVLTVSFAKPEAVAKNKASSHHAIIITFIRLKLLVPFKFQNAADHCNCMLIIFSLG